MKTVAWNKLYNLQYIKYNAAAFSSYRLFEDELFFLNILFSKNKKSFSLINKPLVRVIKRKDSRSRSFSHLEIKTFFSVQIENFKFVNSRSKLTLLIWILFYFPKSLISFLFSLFKKYL